MPAAGSCRICNHPRAEEINAELLAPGMNRRSLRGVASLFHISPETMRRHYHNCLKQGFMDDLADTTQALETVYDVRISLTNEHAAKIFELNGRSQRCGNPVQMMVIARELLELLANMVKSG